MRCLPLRNLLTSPTEYGESMKATCKNLCFSLHSGAALIEMYPKPSNGQGRQCRFHLLHTRCWYVYTDTRSRRALYVKYARVSAPAIRTARSRAGLTFSPLHRWVARKTTTNETPAIPLARKGKNEQLAQKFPNAPRTTRFLMLEKAVRGAPLPLY